MKRAAISQITEAAAMPGESAVTPPVSHQPVAKAFFHIALMVEVDYAFGRAVCQGASRFVQEHDGWLLFPHQTAGGEAKIRGWLQANHITGIISLVNSRNLFLRLQATGIPLVTVLLRDQAPGVTSVIADSPAITRMAVEFFRQIGFWNFAFCGYPGLAFSDLREAAFRETLISLGHTLHTPPAEVHPAHSSIGHENITGAELNRHFKEWLCGLPKPVALLAANDVRGQQVIRLAQELGIDVPGQLAVLGVDNDEVICNMCSPALSSIDSNAEGIGYAAAQALDGLLRGIVRPGTEILLPPTHIVERRSTGLVSTENAVVAQALRIIRDRSRENLTTRVLCGELNCPRAKLDLLFKQHLGRTPAEEITRNRLKGLTDLLQGTDLSLKEIAARFNFSSTNSFSRFIHRETGTTPTALRHQPEA